MKIAILTTGTLGDVKPFLALALGLQIFGHEVTLAAPENFQTYMKPFDVNYHRLSGNTQEILESEQGRRWMASGNAKKFMKELNQIIHEIRYDLQRDLMVACQNCDALIVHPLLIFEAAILSEKLQKPLMFAFPFPFMPATSLFPQLFVRTKRYSIGFLNKLTYRIFAKVHEQGKMKDMNEWRSELDLQPLRGSYYKSLERQEIPILHAYSPTLVPFPKDWGKHNYISGAIKLNSHLLSQTDSQSNEALDKWLSIGPAPIYFGFGSLPILEPQKMLNMVTSITKKLNTRAVIASGWSAVTFEGIELPKTIFMLKTVDHGWLFPRCSCVIHHGGAGTTHTTLESGTPSIICSTYADQPFWGEIISALNIGRSIPFAKLTEENLLQVIRELQVETVKKRAESIGNQLKSEIGLQNALEWIVKHIPTAPVYRNGN